MRKLVLALGAMALLAVACSNSESSTRTSDGGEAEKVAVDAPGVTDSEIRVGGVASVTNPLGGSTAGSSRAPRRTWSSSTRRGASTAVRS